jgi:hypothetical protein
MDLLTQKGRGKNVKMDVVLGKTLGILGHAGFFSPSHNTWKQFSFRA